MANGNTIVGIFLIDLMKCFLIKEILVNQFTCIGKALFNSKILPPDGDHLELILIYFQEQYKYEKIG